MAILLIRHGETPGNARRVVQTPETPLSARGLVQARALAARLADQGVVRILSSDLVRARMTAECLAASTGAPVEAEPMLAERNFGDVRGSAYADLGLDLFAPDYEPPGGESWGAFHERVDTVWQRMAARLPETKGHVAVVTHGLVCHSLVSRHLAADAAIPRDGLYLFGNTALTWVDDAPPWRVRLLACTAHLDPIEAAESGGGGAV